MSVPIVRHSPQRLAKLGLLMGNQIHYQCTPEELTEAALSRKEGTLTSTGALAIRTGQFTGRSPKDKFTVRDPVSEGRINWNEFNLPIEEKFFHVISRKVMDYLNAKPDIWIRDAYVCADPRYRLSLRVVTERPSTNLFAYNMFLRPTAEELEDFKPDWHLFSVPGLELDPEECGTRSRHAIIVSFAHKMVLIAGTGYTGETKKAIFSILNYLLPVERNVLSMHCSANMGADGDTAIFFGLSGTGKTTLSADPKRKLIGDDEHGWGADNIFNFEGGCYAKLIHLSEEREPDIFRAIKGGALVENVTFIEGTHEINFSDDSITENTRVSYPLSYITNAVEPSVGAVPRHIFFLTCDAYGILPPIARLTKAQAMYQFISGYTAKVAGTETGVTEPRPTFSACFGAPFLPLHPAVYAEMLGRKMESNHVHVWLVNTGWTGGSYGTGQRMKLAYTRAMINAVLEGKLDRATFTTMPLFHFRIPTEVPGVPTYILDPRNTWHDKSGYDRKSRYLANLFLENFKKYASHASQEIIGAGPRL